MKKTMYSITLMLCYFVSISQEIKQKVQLNFSNLSQKLQQSRTEKTSGLGNLSNSETIISLPLLDGRFADFKMVEYLIVPENSKTDIRTYYGVKVGDALVTCRVTLTKEKLMASVIENGQTIILEKVTGSLLSNEYQVFVQKKSSELCHNIEEQIKNGRIAEKRGISNYSYGSSLKIYKLALIVTNEFYADYVNDAGVNAEIVAIVNNMNALYEKEVAVRMTLVSPNNPASGNFFYRKTEDTYSVNGVGGYYQNLTAVRTEIDSRFGNANYDLGHCLHNSGGGVAGLGVVCNSTNKGRGWSGSTTANSILLFAHELGHQFDAPHTFNGTGTGNCSVGNRDNGTAFEPGSGSTIMSYFGTCLSTFNLTGSETGYFHSNSLERMSAYIVSNLSGDGGTCGTSSATGNVAPVVNAGTAFSIPKNTPFKLKGTATDANNDALSYTWEQYDLAVVSDTARLGHIANSLGINAVNSSTAPLFRSKQSSTGERTFPNMAFVLNNSNNPVDREGEDLSNVSRTLNFRLTARDNKNGGGGVHCAAVAITVDAAKGPLSVTSPNTSIIIAAGASHTVTWAVNSTNSLSPNVKILLSIDGGGSFPFILSSSTSNDGSESVVIPSNVPNSTLARIIVASNNSSTAEFFDASDVNFSITSSCLVKSSIVCTETPVSAMAGNASLNLSMSQIVANKVLGNSKAYSTVGIGTYPVINYTDNTFSTCQTSEWGNEKAVLVPFQVSETGNYSISLNFQGFAVYSIFTSNSSFNCNTTFYGGNSYAAIGWFSSRTINLNSCTTYYALLYDLNSSNTSITLNLSGPGDFLEIQNMPSGYSYTYAAVNQSNNLIEDVSPSSNFTNTAAGTYKIYGLMYANGFNTNTLTGKTIEQAYGLGSCILFSNNSKPVTIIPNPCAPTVELIHPTHDITTGTVTKVAASGVGGKITASNWVTGSGTRATYTARAIELKEGFVAEQGTIFRAEVGGCN
ncbi:reprolysin-like metallopeptidase [Lacihabitans sp. CS3-21]|uniref:reprolysin-like metallopeptidase n=1 Tax=Lacihabitans sp. CS3-21 TaxID=2487332 RepID=UPI0020CE900A|nr:M12 family metallo-peptidase [Lacihabitans sp. CS3-21]MCP9745473.1 hypothetical protein [Lacihabitans sp. CS3-21]